MKAKLVRQDYLVPLGPVDFGVAMPSIIESADGDLVAVWYAGSINPQSYDPHNADSSVYYARLEKGAAHWTAPEVLDQSPELVHASTAAMRDNAGRIWALYKFRTLEGTWNDSGSGLAARRSSDGGRDLLLPVTMEMTDRYFGECSVFISEDGGETWSRYGEIKADDGTLLREPSIFIRGDGVIQMYMRSCGPGREWSYFPPDKPGRMWESHSNDNGRTWSKARRTTLPNNESTARLAGPLAAEFSLLDRPGRNLGRFCGSSSWAGVYLPSQRYPGQRRTAARCAHVQLPHGALCLL